MDIHDVGIDDLVRYLLGIAIQAKRQDGETARVLVRREDAFLVYALAERIRGAGKL